MSEHYWCGACRDSGAMHCAYPDECGEMDAKKPMSVIERDPAYQRYRARIAKNTDSPPPMSDQP